MKNNEISRQYAKALFELAREADLTALNRELKEVSAFLASHPDLTAFLSSPVFSFEAKDKIFDPFLKKAEVSELAVLFLRLLLKRRRLALIDEIYLEFNGMVMEKLNRDRCVFETAYSLDQATLQRLTEKMEKISGKKLDVEVAENPQLIGGLIARVGEKVYDFSLRARLKALSEALLNY